jgi:hypothetical protein
MWFYDGVGDLVLGSPNDTGFGELGRVAYHWPGGKVHQMSLTITPGDIVASIDGTPIIERGNPNLLDSSKAGIFLRGGGTTQIQEFRVIAP